jgi:predicted phage terminase large subunit-like protein
MAMSTKTSKRGSSASRKTAHATKSSRSTTVKANPKVSSKRGSKATTPIPVHPTSAVSTTPKSLPISGSTPTSAEIELASRLLSRRRLLPFIQRINPRYLAGWVHDDICRRLEKFSDDVAKGLSPRLMLLMPPRHGKSEIASRMFPAWHIGRNPDHEIIACSYNVGLAMSFSRKVKEVLEDPSYQNVFEARLNPNFQGAEEWGINNARGGYVAAGVGGGITGKGAHVLTIDDPLKNAEEADSADIREKLKDWYDSTAYTRLAPGGGVLIVQTWWHDDDLAGRLQTAMAADEEADQFVVVKYPAIAEADEWLDLDTDLIKRVEHNFNVITGVDEDGEPVAGTDNKMRAYVRAQALKVDTTRLKFLRGKGEALHPERYDIQKLNRIKRTIQPRFWSALYQQNPVPDDGDFFLKEHFKRGEIPEIKNANVFIAWDFAISEKKQNDYTVGTVGLQDWDDVLHVAEVVRFKSADAFYIVEAILNQVARWYSPGLLLGFEDGQIWRAIEALLKKRMRERRMYPSITVLKPISDKLARARPLQGRMQQGMVSFSAGAAWFDSLQAEMLRFPAAAHDDQVDSMAWMTQLAIGREPPRKPQPKKEKSWKDKLGIGGLGSHMTA